ncbi:DMT family transporter [Desulfovibrio cuneatus]|uniref:DMT family transporter n=1 Tax=Desulfovibrio cuneatus TaxID=159728 RepID=UPI000414EF48|nr:DMT family transporter [Desulfovibrio cuneatus]
MKQASSSPGFWVRPEVRGSLFAFLATLVWSGNVLVSRQLVGHMPPFAISLYRIALAFVVILPLAAVPLWRHRQHYWAHKGYYACLAAIGFSFASTVTYIVAHSVPAMNISLIGISSPLFTLLFGRMLFGDVFTPRQLGGLAVVLVGVLFLLAKGNLGVLLHLSFSRHDLLMLGGAAGFAVYTVLLRKKPNGGSQVCFLAVTFGLGGLFLLPAFVLELQQTGFMPPWKEGVRWPILFLGLGPSLFSYWAWGRAVQLAGAARAMLIYYTLPLLAGLQAALFLGEPLLVVHAISGVLIIGGLLLATLSTRAS